MNGAVALTGGPCHDGDPSVEEIPVRQFKTRLTTPEKFWEHPLEACVDEIKGFFEAAPAFSVYFFDGIAERCE